MNRKEDEVYLHRTIFWLGLITTISTVITIVVLAYSSHSLLPSMLERSQYVYLGGNPTSLDLDESALDLLLESEKIISADQFIEQLASFYETVIVVLLAVLTLVSGAAFFVIRTGSISRIEEVVEENLQRIVPREIENRFCSNDFHKQVQNEVTPIVEEVTNEWRNEMKLLRDSRDALSDVLDLAEHYSPQGILEGLKTLERRVAELDPGTETGEEEAEIEGTTIDGGE